MIELTEAARNCLDQYLSELRVSLAGCPSVSRSEVESDVMQHIETSLAGADALLGLDGSATSTCPARTSRRVKASSPPSISRNSRRPTCHSSVRANLST